MGRDQGDVASVSGSDIRIDGRIEEGNSGGPILMNGSVAGMVTSSNRASALPSRALSSSQRSSDGISKFPHRLLLGLDPGCFLRRQPAYSSAWTGRSSACRASAVFQQLGRCVESEV